MMIKANEIKKQEEDKITKENRTQKDKNGKREIFEKR